MEGLKMAVLNTDEIVWNEVLTEAEFDLLFRAPLKVMYNHSKMIRFDPEIVEIMKLLNSGQSSTSTALSEKDIVILIIIATVYNQNSQQVNPMLVVNLVSYLGNQAFSQITGCIGRAMNIFSIGTQNPNSDQAKGIAKFNNYKNVAPIRLHFYYRKAKNNTNKFLFTGSSGSPNITVCCPIPKKQLLYSGPMLTQIYKNMITDIKKILVDIPIANTSQACKAGFLKVLGATSGFASDSGYLHYDTYNPSNSGVSKDREYEIYSAMVKNPYLLIEFINDVKLNNEICQLDTGTGRPNNLLLANSSINFTMKNPWETFQITSVIAPGVCTAGYNYQICHKVGFTINGIDASLVVMDGSGWCGV
jgi:hypothetical protein